MAKRTDFSRKVFLKQMGLGLSGLAFTHSFTGCQTISRQACMDRSLDKKYRLSPAQENAANLACLAPSGHNSQPWQLRIEQGHEWYLQMSSQRLLPAVDPSMRESCFSLGAWYENLQQASSAMGYQTHFRILTDKLRPESDLVKINWSKKNGKRSDSKDIEQTIRRIKMRRTLRKNFLIKKINSRDKERLINLDSRSIFYFSFDSPQGQFLKKAALAANKKQLMRFAVQKELSESIHWSADAAMKSCTGLTPKSMEISGLAGWYVSHFFSPDDVLTESFKKQTMAMVHEQVNQGSGWLVVTSQDNSLTQIFQAGCLYERCALAAQDLNISLHPMSQVLEEYPWKKNLNKSLGLDKPIQFVLRLGYVQDYLSPVSLRLPLAKIII